MKQQLKSHASLFLIFQFHGGNQWYSGDIHVKSGTDISHEHIYTKQYKYDDPAVR
jgi:hypothetical protein